MGPRTLLVATGAALAMAGVGACGAAGSNASHAAGPAHSASASPSQRSTSQGSGTTAQTGAGSSGSSATGTSSTVTGTISSTVTGTGATGGGQDETVGIWPVSTRAQAIQLQQSADAGHQPWLTDPTQVAVAYVRSEWHVSQPYVQRISATRYVARIAAAGQTILTVAQPVQTGSGGIWVIVSATQQRS